MMEGVNLSKIYCKHFVNVTVYPQYNNNMIIKSKVKYSKKKLRFWEWGCGSSGVLSQTEGLELKPSTIKKNYISQCQCLLYRKVISYYLLYWSYNQQSYWIILFILIVCQFFKNFLSRQLYHLFKMLLYEVSQAQKTKNRMFSLICRL
jgi:hypothetical protein